VTTYTADIIVVFEVVVFVIVVFAVVVFVVVLTDYIVAVKVYVGAAYVLAYDDIVAVNAYAAFVVHTVVFVSGNIVDDVAFIITQLLKFKIKKKFCFKRLILS
jgi:hypothetical protein